MTEVADAGVAAPGHASAPKESRAEWEASVGCAVDPRVAATRLAELAAGRPVLEFDLSSDRMNITLPRQTTCSDLRTSSTPGQFGLIFIPGPGLFALPTLEQQTQFFYAAAQQLEPGGRFVVEVPSAHSSWIENGRCWTIEVGPQHVVLLAKRSDPVTQRMDMCYIHLRDGESPTVRSLVARYAFPSEIDLMAHMAGMRPVHRWSGWNGQAFTTSSRLLVAVYEKPQP